MEAKGTDEEDILTKLRRENEELKRENEDLKYFVKKLFTEGGVDPEVLPPAFRGEVEEDERNFVIRALLENSDWLEIPQKWKDDVDVACAIFDKYAKCRNLPKWKDLPYHLLTNQKVLVHALASTSWTSPEWNEIPWWMQNNPDVICAAYMSRKLRYKDIPQNLKRSHREIALRCIKEG
eukprot:scaffold6655_cov169-Amphora_coffeaeformis.AAC.11